MEKMGLNELRELFLSFYESKGHYRRKSFPLIPQDDKSLLIINSGMAPLKPFFAGTKTPPAPRMTTCQKCIRTADIDNVGFTARHGTFFEMLGSFSFGDYFKEESIRWGWEFITDRLKLPVERLWASVYEDDDEAYAIWRDQIHMPEERIVRLGKEDNFWEIGAGPCGPCSEIYYDRGEKYGCGKDDCKPGCDCDRYIEFWNHVFTQFSNDGQGNYSELASKNIDTGLGLERLACIMQDVDSIFAVDTLRYIIDAIVAKSGVSYENGAVPTDVSIRIITDHMRSATFMVGDKILPGNEGRGYVLRRLIRRASRHGRKLGIEGTFLAEIAGKVIDVSAGAYPELEEQREFICRIISREEEKFNETLSQGLHLLDKAFEQMSREGGAPMLPGEVAFRLHDTYGLPLEITEEICKEKGVPVDVDGFRALMALQKEAGQQDAAASDEGWKNQDADGQGGGETCFTGYEKIKDRGRILSIFGKDGRLARCAAGDTVEILLDQTPFYAAGGGQNGDRGLLAGPSGEGEVLDVVRRRGMTLHQVRVIEGTFAPGEELLCQVDEIFRNSTARNHTGTHLLHKALRMVLGDHVAQAGSSVTADGLRFDFSHYEAMTREQLDEVEYIVNEQIDLFQPVVTREMSLAEATEAGAVGLFEEKYGATVRVVAAGDFSMELCGGIHVADTGQIGALRILGESGIASGVRRIEAVTGGGVLRQLRQKESVLQAGGDLFKSSPELLLERISNLQKEHRELKKELESFKKEGRESLSKDLLAEAKEINGIRLIAKEFHNMETDELRDLSDKLREGQKDLALVFASVKEDKAAFLVSLTEDLVSRGYHAGKMVKEIAAAAGGGGGGKADMAQAGARDLTKIKDALGIAEKLL
jgi:alanyl-tRNA synthetase